MVLADLADGTPEKRHLHAVDATDVGDQDLQNRVDHGPQDSQSPGRPVARGLDLSWNVSGPSNQNILENILIENCLNVGATLDNFMDSRVTSLQIRNTTGANPVSLSYKGSGGSWELNSCYFTGLIQLESQNGTLVNCGVYGGIELPDASEAQICMVGGQLYKNPITGICVNSSGNGDTSQSLTFLNVQWNNGICFSGSYFTGARIIGGQIHTNCTAFASNITPLAGGGRPPVFKLEHVIVSPTLIFDTSLASYVLDCCRGTSGAVLTPSNYVINKTASATSDLITLPNSFKVEGRDGQTYPIGNGFLLGSNAYATGNQSPAAMGKVLLIPSADVWIDVGVGGSTGSVTGAWIVTVASTYDGVSAIYSVVKSGYNAGVCTKIAGQNDSSLSMQWDISTAQPQIKFT